MIQANELRIGNLVTENNGIKTFEIHGIGKTGVNGWGCCTAKVHGEPKNTYFIDNDYKDLIGIQLTEEWLIRFGFSKKIVDEGKLNCDGSRSPFPRKYYCIYNVVLLETENKYIVVHNLGTPMKYVHQLQNLYFALTGEELTIK